mgnify:CR=1 FL=1
MSTLDVFSQVSIHADNVCLKPVPWKDLETYGLLITNGLFTQGQQNTAGMYYDPDNLVDSARKLVSEQLSSWSSLTAESWKLDFGIYVDNVLVGRQLVGAENFLLSKMVYSDSFVIPAWRSKGVGTKARAAMSTAMVSNAASDKVSQTLG